SAGAGRTFTDEAWERAAAIRAAVDELPFLRELEAGTLPREVFTGYLAQDALYLAPCRARSSRATSPRTRCTWPSTAGHSQRAPSRRRGRTTCCSGPPALPARSRSNGCCTARTWPI